MLRIRAEELFSAGSQGTRIKQNAIRGSLVVGSAQVLATVMGLTGTIVLTRLLSPADFGLVAMVAVCSNFAGRFVDAGLSSATVQQKEITQAQVSNLFWIATALGTLLTILLIAASPLISLFYGEPRLIAITIVISSSLFCSGLTVQYRALLRRGMKFNHLAVTSLLAQLSGLIVGISWALMFRGQSNSYWALVAGSVASSSCVLALSWLVCSWRPSRPRRNVGTRSLINFGADLTAFSFFNYFARNMDNLLIGWYWGPITLGLYDRAYRLFLTPLSKAIRPLGSVMFPVLSRLSSEKLAFTRTYIAALRLLMLVFVPASIVIAITANWWVDLLLGDEWLATVPIFRWLSIVSLVQPFTSTGGWLFKSQGKSREMLKLGFISGSSTVVSFVIGLPWGAEGVAASYALTGLIFRTPLLIYWIRKHEIIDHTKILEVLNATVPPTVAVTIANIALLWFGHSLSSMHGAILCVSVSLVIWLATVPITETGRIALAQIYSLIRDAFGRVNKMFKSESNES